MLVMAILENYLLSFFEQLLNSPKLSHLQSWIINDIKEKLMHLPDNNTTSIIIPLLHLQ